MRVTSCINTVGSIEISILSVMGRLHFRKKAKKGIFSLKDQKLTLEWSNFDNLISLICICILEVL